MRALPAALVIAALVVASRAPAFAQTANDAPAKSSPTLAQYRAAGSDRGDMVVAGIRTLIDDYRSPYNRAGRRKPQELFLANIEAAKFIEQLFYTDNRSERTRNRAALLDLMEQAAQDRPSDTVERVILFFITEKYKQQRPD